MDWLTMDGINWLSVFVAFLVSFGIGAFWYSKAGLLPKWLELGNISEEEMENASMGVAFGGTLAANLFGVLLLAILVNGLGIDSLGGGLLLGLLIGLIFRGGAHALHNGFAIRNPMITVIDTAHDTVGLAVAGAILGAMM